MRTFKAPVTLHFPPGLFAGFFPFDHVDGGLEPSPTMLYNLFDENLTANVSMIFLQIFKDQKVHFCNLLHDDRSTIV